MKLRAEQMRAFDVVAWAEFELRLITHWRKSSSFRVQQLEDEALRGLAQAAIAEARGKGLTTERDIVTYADLCLAVGTGFAVTSRHPSACKGGR